VCRLDIASAHEVALARGIRVVSPDRPGVGGSDRRPGRTLVDWADDVRELTEAIGIDRFSTIGWSMGGQYALALAHSLADRVDMTIVVAGCPPLDDPHHFAALSRLDQRLSEQARHHPARARATFGAMRAMARWAPKRFTETSARGLGAVDGAVARRPAIAYAPMVAEALRQSHGAVDEYRVFTDPWGFDPSGVTTPVQVWWGTDDQLVSRPLLDALVASLPACHLTVVPDAGHFVAVDRWADVLAPVAA
jgi:pimeloyl-ACP methyl ester carboxylesterase